MSNCALAVATSDGCCRCSSSSSSVKNVRQAKEMGLQGDSILGAIGIKGPNEWTSEELGLVQVPHAVMAVRAHMLH